MPPAWLFPFCLALGWSNLLVNGSTSSPCIMFFFFSIKYHRHKHQECLLAGIEKRNPKQKPHCQTVDSIGFLYCNLGRQSSSPSDFFFFFFFSVLLLGSDGQDHPSSDLTLFTQTLYFCLQRCVLFTSCLQFSCHLAACEKGTDSGTSLPKVRYTPFHSK